MALSVKEAADLVGMSKQGINRAINKGKLSATKNLDGEWEIEPVELFRVYPPVATEAAIAADNETPELVSPAESLRKQIELLERIIRDKNEQIDDLRTQREGWQAQAEEANRQRKLLEDKQQAETQVATELATTRQTWWQRLFS